MTLKCTKTLQEKRFIYTLECTHKWKSYGIEEITNFWFYHQSSSQQLRTKLVSGIIKELEKKNVWLSHRRSKTKTKDTTKAKKELPTKAQAMDIKQLLKINQPLKMDDLKLYAKNDDRWFRRFTKHSEKI